MWLFQILAITHVSLRRCGIIECVFYSRAAGNELVVPNISYKHDYNRLWKINFP